MALTDVCAYYSEYFAARPWRLGSWIWATQGHILVAVADDGREADPTPAAKVKAQHYLDDDLIDAVSCALPALRAFAGPVLPASVPCEDCNGSGRENGDFVTCEHCGINTRLECSSCGGDGAAGIEVRYGRVAGVLVNLVLLAFGLSQVPHDDTATLGTLLSNGAQAHQVLAVSGQGWRVVLMGCTDVESTVPSFPAVEPAGCGQTGRETQETREW